MKTNIEEVRAQINEARVRLANAEAELAKMEAKPAKWEPKGGRHCITFAGEIIQASTDHQSRLDGSEYPTREAAESALPYVTFYKRLCCLAQELNPSGKVGGSWFVVFDPDANGWKSRMFHKNSDITALFETELAALRASEIMTRDAWRLP